MKVLITAAVAAITMAAQAEWGTPIPVVTEGRLADATNATLDAANAYTDAHRGDFDTNAVERIANEAVRTNGVTVALVSATNDLTAAVAAIPRIAESEFNPGHAANADMADVAMQAVNAGQADLANHVGTYGQEQIGEIEGNAASALARATTNAAAIAAHGAAIVSNTAAIAAIPPIPSYDPDGHYLEVKAETDAYPRVPAVISAVSDIGPSREAGLVNHDSFELYSDNESWDYWIVKYKRDGIHGWFYRSHGIEERWSYDWCFPNQSGTFLVTTDPSATNAVRAVGVVSSDVVETNETPRLFAAAPGRGLLAAAPPQSVTTQRLDTARAIVDYTRRFVATAATQGTNYTDACCGAIAVSATNYTDAAMTAAIRSAENYTDGVLDSAAYLPRFYFKGGRWYRQDLVDNGPDDIEMTLERYGDDVFVWFEAVGGPATVTLTNVKASATAPKLERLKDGAWSPFAFPVLLAEGERVIFRTQYGVTNSAYWKSDAENWKFGGTGRYAVGGDATALFVYEGSIPCPAEAFHGLFENNECLVDASRLVLPFAELAYDCYAMMFAGCSNLAKGPHVLPAKDVPERGYLSMFNGCEALDLAPRILAEDAAATYAMANMFVNCKALDHVYLPYLTNATAYALFGFANNATNVSRIATLANTFGGLFANGTTDRGVLICKTSLGTQDTIARGANACPTNWLVENIDAPFVQFTNAYGVPSEVTVLWSSGTAPKLEYLAEGTNWTAITLAKGTAFTLATLNSYGDRVMVRAETGKTNVAMKGTKFIVQGKADVSGNIMSLVNQSCPTAITASNMFAELFGLATVPADPEQVWVSDGIAASDGLSLPATTLASYCYDSMFAMCRRMRYSPLTLPAASLPQRSCSFLLWRCLDMVESPDVLASAASSTYGLRSIYMNDVSLRRVRFPNLANVTQGATLDWAIRFDEYFGSQDTSIEYIETAMTAFKNNNGWVEGVKNHGGLFVCPASLGNRETIRRGDSACPYGWDVINIR